MRLLRGGKINDDTSIILHELLNKVAEKLKAQFKDMQFHTGRAWFDFDAAIDRCCEKVDKVIADIKSEAFNEG